MKKVMHLFINQVMVASKTQLIPKKDKVEILFSTLSTLAAKEKSQLIIIALDSQQQLQALQFIQDETSWFLQPVNQNPSVSTKSIIQSSLLVTEGVLVIDDAVDEKWLSLLQMVHDMNKPLIGIVEKPNSMMCKLASTLIVNQGFDGQHKDVWIVSANSDIVLQNEQMLLPSYQTKTRPFSIIAPLFGLAYLIGATRYNRMDACVFAAKVAAITYDQYME